MNKQERVKIQETLKEMQEVLTRLKQESCGLREQLAILKRSLAGYAEDNRETEERKD